MILPTTIYEPDRVLRLGIRIWREMICELWASRELVWRLFMRDLSARYKQSVLGYVWAMTPAIAVVGAFTYLSRSRILPIPGTDMPYPAYVLLGLAVWQLFATGLATKYLAVVSNRAGEVAALIRWHWQKAGTIELVHDVTKNELGAAVPPCPPPADLGANAAWYRLSLLTYNVLSALKSLALPASLSAARPKRLRFAVFTLAGRLVSHAGRLWVRVSAEAERLAGLIAACARLALIAQAVPAG